MPASRRHFCKTLTAVMAASALGSQSQAASLPIRVAVSTDYVPLSYADESGALQGLVLQSLKLVGRKVGCAFEFKGTPWARVQELIKGGEVDACYARPTDERRTFLDFVEQPVISDRAGIVHRADNRRISAGTTLAQLADLRIGMLLGTTWATELFPNQKHMAAANLDSVVNMVAYDRLDAFIESEIVANCKIDTGAYPAPLAFTPVPEIAPAIYCFGLRRDYPDRGPLLKKIAVAVAELHASGELEALRYRFSLPRRKTN